MSAMSKKVPSKHSVFARCHSSSLRSPLILYHTADFHLTLGPPPAPGAIPVAGRVASAPPDASGTSPTAAAAAGAGDAPPHVVR